MGAGASAGIAAAVQTMSDEELKSLVAALGPDGAAKLQTALVPPTAPVAAGPIEGMRITQQRITFSKQVDDALVQGADALANLQMDINNMRAQICREVRGNMPQEERTAMFGFQVLLQEQANTVRTLIQAGDGASSVWKDEIQLEGQAGAIEVRCGDTAIPLGSDDDAANPMMLVVTDLSRTCRRAYFQAVAGKQILVFQGPAGTGKTETIKDTGRLTGREARILNGTCHSPDTVFKDFFNAAIDVRTSKDEFTPVIIDEANRIAKDELMEIATRCQDVGVFLCLTFNPGYPGRNEIHSDLLANAVTVDMTVPSFALIFSAMLASEGFQFCDDLGGRMDKLICGARDGCSKQSHYDFGFRASKAVFRAAGINACTEGFTTSEDTTLATEKTLLAKTVLARYWPRLTTADKDVFKALVKEHLEEDVGLPTGFEGGDNKWATAATMMTHTLKARHGAMFVGVDVDDVEKCLNALRDEAKVNSIELVRMPGSMAESSFSELYSIDGKFATELKKKQSWITVVCGSMSKEDSILKFEKLNTLLDDNKVLVHGEKSTGFADADQKIIFLINEVVDLSPATVSRLGIVLIE